MVSLIKKTDGTATFTQTNVYDHAGSRVSKTEGTVTREYYYVNGSVAYTEDNNSLSASNLTNPEGSILATKRSSSYYNYLKNMQGSTGGLVSETGTAAVVYSYTDFGETTEVAGGSFDNEICYTGAIYDEETSLYYLNARYYDPANGRFISQDSYRGEINDEGTWHLYTYCANNPINYVDPTGHKVISIGFKGEVAAVFGAYAMFSVNTDFKYILFCVTAGAKAITNVSASAGIVVTYYGYKNVDKLPGWGFSTGISYSVGVKISASGGIDITKSGDITGHISGSAGVGGSIFPIPYIDTEFGYTWKLKKMKISNVSKNKKTYRLACQKITVQKKNSYVEVKKGKRKIRIYTKSNRVKVL